MEIAISAFRRQEIPAALLDELTRDFEAQSRLLGVSSYTDEDLDSDWYQDSLAEDAESGLARPPLGAATVAALRGFGAAVGREISAAEIAARWAPGGAVPDAALLAQFEARKILAEQLGYASEGGEEGGEEGCVSWFVVGYLGGVPYGGVCVFWSPRAPGSALMQGISKFFVPSLFAQLFPEEEKALPRLNSVLMPAVEAVAREAGARRVQVAPVGRQGGILERHYGFRRVGRVAYPCARILGRRAVEAEPGRYELYEKELPE